MNRRSVLSTLLSIGFLTYIENPLNNIFKKVVHCNIEDFWDTVKYEEERSDGKLLRNIWRVEDYPTCSYFKRIKFEQLKDKDYFIMLSSKYDYIGPYYGYGFVSQATSDVFKSGETVGIQQTGVCIKQCWTAEAFEKHMILSGADYSSPNGHWKNSVKIG